MIWRRCEALLDGRLERVHGLLQAEQECRDAGDEDQHNRDRAEQDGLDRTPLDRLGQDAFGAAIHGQAVEEPDGQEDPAAQLRLRDHDRESSQSDKRSNRQHRERDIDACDPAQPASEQRDQENSQGRQAADDRGLKQEEVVFIGGGEVLRCSIYRIEDAIPLCLWPVLHGAQDQLVIATQKKLSRASTTVSPNHNRKAGV